MIRFKEVLLISLLVMPVVVVDAQTIYAPGGTVGTSANGNVGVGTSSPMAKVEIHGDSAQNTYSVSVGEEDLRVLSSSNRSYDGGIITLGGSSGPTGYIKTAAMNSAGGEIIIGNRRGPTDTTMQPGIVLNYYGNVGIGTSAPTAKLQVQVDNAGLNIVAGLRNQSGAESGGNAVGVGFLNEGLGDWWKAAIVHERTGSYGRGSLHFLLNNTSDNSSVTISDAKMSITSDGRIGIGTTTPTHKLTVNGTIRAKEVIVDTGWSDYVFDPDYRLAPLAEVKEQIRQQGHLPGIPSAQEVAEHGVSMGEMQSKLLAKIEELTLHVIAQQEQLAAQSARIERLEAEKSRHSTP